MSSALSRQQELLSSSTTATTCCYSATTKFPHALFTKEQRAKMNLPSHFSLPMGYKFCQLQNITSNKTLQSIKCYMVMQESLDPYQEEDLVEDLEQDTEEDAEEDAEEASDSSSEVSNNSNNNTSQGNLNHRNLTINGSNWIQSNDPCFFPGHLGYNWGQCYQNASNTSMRATRTSGSCLNMMRTKTNTLVSRFKDGLHETTIKVLANQPLVRKQEGKLAIAAMIVIVIIWNLSDTALILRNLFPTKNTMTVPTQQTRTPNLKHTSPLSPNPTSIL
jgi:hypothetical protein